MNITINGGSLCTSGGHLTIATDKGNLKTTVAKIKDLLPDDLSDAEEPFLIVFAHLYKSRIAAGRTQTQALSDLVGQVVRL